MIATGLGMAKAGRLRLYLAPFALTRAQADRAGGRVPGPLGDRIASELNRRSVSDEISAGHVSAKGSAHELCAVLARRLGARDDHLRRLADWRDRGFDKRVAGLVDRDDRAVFVAYAAALRTIEAARSKGVETLLEYVVAHHEFSERILHEELGLRPEYASTMQFHRVAQARRARLDAEIEAADRILVGSEFVKQTFVDSGVAGNKIVATPYPTDLTRFAPAPRSDDGVFRVLFVGQLTQRKGLSYLVDAFERAAIPDSELLLVGSPVGAAAPWRGRPGVRQIDWVAPWDTPALYAKADVFVLPSLVEGFARVVPEAMACGVPVVVTPNTGAGDVVRDGWNGYLVPIRDAAAIADRLRTLASDAALRARLGAAARRDIERLGTDSYGARMVELLA